jgi:hypothetical protein
MSNRLPLAKIGPTEALILAPVAILVFLAVIVAPLMIWRNVAKTRKLAEKSGRKDA